MKSTSVLRREPASSERTEILLEPECRIKPVEGRSFLKVKTSIFKSIGLPQGSRITVTERPAYQDGQIVAAEVNGFFHIGQLRLKGTTVARLIAPQNGTQPVDYVLAQFDSREILGEVSLFIQ